MTPPRSIPAPPSWPFRLSVLPDGSVRINKAPKQPKPQAPKAPGPDVEPALL